MPDIIRVLLLGMLVSFLGQLPLGNVNIAATQLNVQESQKNAWKFAAGLVVIEVIYLRLALTGINWIIRNKLLFVILGWTTVVLFLILGIASFIAARKQSEDKKALMLNNKLDRFLLGLSISAVNPVQIPFWLTWSLYLINGKMLHPIASEYNFFTIGAGFGTLGGLAVYIYGGKWAIQKIKANNKSLNMFMGVVFIVVAFLQLYKMIYMPWTENLK
ncbi:MAG: LysE family transporter [Chitinophagaceae bacterium]|nr:LysE family transporter [Chitinophagaceae bacterium]